ncbi:phage antirepressor N-terminal domain-containing protein [Galactobacter valiniphilus]|uniref:phage antirepressor N-terminal domain-containing protein n=1 Tax=Galactobacter valiniphilus TaxID=2676122 RepID=UPI0013143325|nr:phage antirepressor N-terminal domain-containing protein [Galactobacter valiniphilus]
MTSLVQIPFHNTSLSALSEDGKPLVSLRHMCESIGIDYPSQLKRVKRSHWATVVMMTTVADDGKDREMAMVNRRTMTMWLATIDPARLKNEDAKAYLALFQNEAADALDAYFHEGAALNRGRSSTTSRPVFSTVSATSSTLLGSRPRPRSLRPEPWVRCRRSRRRTCPCTPRPTSTRSLS